MVAPNGIYKLAVIGTVAGQSHVHTLHFRSTISTAIDPWDEDAAQADLLSAWQTGCRTAYRGIFTTDHTPIQTYQIRKVCGTPPLPAGLDASETGPNSVGSINGAAVGAGEAMAPWLANVVTERTSLAGRRYRGRFFLGGLYEGFVAGSAIGAGRLTPTQVYADALVATFVTPPDTTKEWALFVYSLKQAKEFPATPCQNTGANVRTLQVQGALASMKSRKAGSGI